MERLGLEVAQRIDLKVDPLAASGLTVKGGEAEPDSGIEVGPILGLEPDFDSWAGPEAGSERGGVEGPWGAVPERRV